MAFETVLIVLVVAAALYFFPKWLAMLFPRVTVFDYERGLRYEDGKLVDTVSAGSYRYKSWRTTIKKIDVRPKYVTIPSQEVLSQDGIAIKISLAVNTEIFDAGAVVDSVADADQALYLVVQVALRKIISALDIDQVLERRELLGELIHTQAKESPEQFGTRLLSVDIKDITFPGSLKQTFAQVVKARHDGLAALERARGEAAALRSLANTAKILDGNPTLMNLRLLQSLDESSGNSLVLKVTGEKAD